MEEFVPCENTGPTLMCKRVDEIHSLPYHYHITSWFSLPWLLPPFTLNQEHRERIFGRISSL